MGRLIWGIVLVLAGCQVAFDPAPSATTEDARAASCERNQDCRQGERCEEFVCTAMHAEAATERRRLP